jgi:hypothetical protein
MFWGKGLGKKSSLGEIFRNYGTFCTSELPPSFSLIFLLTMRTKDNTLSLFADLIKGHAFLVKGHSYLFFSQERLWIVLS